MKWEYQIVKIASTSHIGAIEYPADELNILGEEGWEAVSSWSNPVGAFILLKRQKAA
jgi:hypothetical protein